jgi:hypothetical protein
MLRFVPDSWLELLLRPFLLIDSVAGLYSEIQAPDLRIAALVLFALIAWAARRGRLGLDGVQGRLLVGFAAYFYLWTAVIGNARYFLWGLLVVGPLVMMMIQRLPGTRSLRNTATLLLLAMQVLTVSMVFEPNIWAFRTWRNGPGLALADTPQKRQPAVYVTIGSISYSLLVPQLHPASRWTNIGQQEIRPGTYEDRRLRDLLASPLPHYAVVRATGLAMDAQRQPLPAARVSISGSLARQKLALTEDRCEFVHAPIAGLPFEVAQRQLDDGFWFCPIVRVSGAPALAAQVEPRLNAAFDQVERRCPRFFQPGGGRVLVNEDGVTRYYPDADVGLTINPQDDVYFKHFRALNPTVIGEVDAVARGEFALDCASLPGRYVPPWSRP